MGMIQRELERQLQRDVDRGRGTLSIPFRGLLCMALVLIALAFGFIGAQALTQATVGVGCIGLGCLVGIIARIIQAGSHS